MIIQEALKLASGKLRSAGIDSYRLDSLLLLEKAANKPRSWLLAHQEEDISDDVASAYLELVSARSQRIPLVHLTNSREFYGLDFYIDEHVLTPRVETEKMVEFALKHAPQNSRLIDVGTGSGAIAIAIKHARPDLEVWGSDVTDESLEVAKRNAKHHQADIKLIKSDLLTNIDERFETVVTNLPYLRNDADLMPEVRREPGVALFGGEDGLELYRRFLKQLPNHLAQRGCLFTECDPWQQADLIEEAARIGLQPIEQDYFILGFQLKA